MIKYVWTILIGILFFTTANALDITLKNNTYERIHYFHFQNSNLFYGSSDHGEEKSVPAYIAKQLTGKTETISVVSTTHLFQCGQVNFKTDDVIVVTATVDGCWIQKY